MARLAGRALAWDIETDFARTLVRARRLTLDDPQVIVERWPWPVRIHCLGQFELQRDDQPLRFSRKAPKKPLELLKVLVTYGGEGVSEARLKDALWPDGEGDTEHQTFKMTLHRLRKLVGAETIRHQQGQLSLNSAVCWLDVTTFEAALKLLDRPEPSLSEADWENLHQALSLYRGDFLPTDPDALWSIARRDDLRRRFVKGAISVGRHFERQARWEAGVVLYQHALTVEPSQELFYAGLMRAYCALEQRAAARDIYFRYWRVQGVENPDRRASSLDALFQSLNLHQAQHGSIR